MASTWLFRPPPWLSMYSKYPHPSALFKRKDVVARDEPLDGHVLVEVLVGAPLERPLRRLSD